MTGWNGSIARLPSSSQGGGSLSFVTGFGSAGATGAFDATDPQHPVWRNVSASKAPPYTEGVTEYLRFGKAGIYVSVGGYTPLSPPAPTGPFLGPLVDMKLTSVYDIAASEWSTITAEGDIPPPRQGACSAVAAAADYSSFQLHMYGGETDQGETLDDLYILTIPAFRWIKIQSKSSPDSDRTANQGRYASMCASYQDRQMIVLGGRNADKYSDFRCNPQYPMLKLLDTSTFEWQTQYPLKNTTYEVPKVVTDVIGGGPRGGAKPASAWQQTLGDKVTLFNRTIPKYKPPQIFGTVNSNSTGSASRVGSNRNTATAAAVGTIGGLVLLAGSASLFIIKRRRRHLAVEAEQAYWDKPELGARRSSGSVAGIVQTRKVEVQGSSPEDILPKEMDAHDRHEMPSGSEQGLVHELGGDSIEREFAASEETVAERKA